MNRPIQHPLYPQKIYSGESVKEFIERDPHDYCHECKRFHGLTEAQRETLRTLRTMGKLY